MTLIKRAAHYLPEDQVFIWLLIFMVVLRAALLGLTDIDGFERLFFTRTSDLFKEGVLPHVDYYPAHPPPWFTLIGVVGKLVNYDHASLIAATRTMTLVLWGGSLVLVYTIAKAAFDKRHALVASVLFSMGPVTLLSLRHGLFDVATAFLVLLAIYCLVVRQSVGLFSLFVAIAVSVKVWPIILLLVVVKRGWREIVRSTAIVGLVLLALWLPFLVASPRMFLSPFAYNLGRGPWQTVWALLDGYYHSGASLEFNQTFTDYFSLRSLQDGWPLLERMNTGTFLVFYHWSRPWLSYLSLVTLSAALLFAWLVYREAEERKETIMFTVSLVTLFFLFSKGWSGGWEAFLLPVLALGATTAWRRCLVVTFLVGSLLQDVYFFSRLGLSFPPWWDSFSSLVSWHPNRILLIFGVALCAVALGGLALSILWDQMTGLQDRLSSVLVRLRISRSLLARSAAAVLFALFASSVVAFLLVFPRGGSEGTRITVRDEPYWQTASVDLTTERGSYYRYTFDSLTDADFTLYDDSQQVVEKWPGRRKVEFALKAQSEEYTLKIVNLERTSENEPRASIFTIWETSGRANKIIDKLFPASLAIVLTVTGLAYLALRAARRPDPAVTPQGVGPDSQERLQ